MIKTINLFPVPVGFGIIQEDINEFLLKEITDTDFKSRYGTGVNLIQTEFGIETKLESVKTLKSILDKELASYMTMCGVQCSTNTTRYWANIDNSPSGYNMPHVHSFARGTFSCVYFPMSIREFGDQDEHTTYNDHPPPGSLVLIDPIQAARSGMCYLRDINRSKFSASPICIEPRQSHFVVFPNYLQHMVAPTNKDILRVSIVCDVELLDKKGHNEDNPHFS